MRLLERPYADSFKELCAHYPLFYLDVYEMREILKAEGRWLDSYADDADAMLANLFLLTADEATIELWEEALSITHADDLTLEQRRGVILAKFSGHRHFGAPEIREIVAPLIDGDITVTLVGGTIVVRVLQEGQGARAYKEARSTLIPKIPAHLALDLKVQLRSDERFNLYSGAALHISRVITIQCEEPPDLEVTYFVDENGDILADEDGNRFIDGEEENET